MMRRYMRRGPMRRGVDRPERRWVSLNTGWSTGALTSTTAVTLFNMEMPTTLSSLTSALPEDLTLMRVMGDFAVTMSSEATWTLYLVVADATWTPNGFSSDADKRILWSQTYENLSTGFAGFVGSFWFPPGMLYTQATASSVTGVDPRCTHMDIKPKAKLEAGKTLYLVANEIAGAATFEVIGRTMRALVQMSRRR